jgi:hypothetical protein
MQPRQRRITLLGGCAGRLVRVHLGLEHAQDLCDDLAQALSHIYIQIFSENLHPSEEFHRLS